MRLSFIVVAHDMGRELPRTLQSLSRSYQHNTEDISYEVVVVDNGSVRPLTEDNLSCAGVPLRVLSMSEKSVSPAAAVNAGIAAAQGELLCLMIDGAHLLTPGVVDWTCRAFAAFPEPVVALRYFYLGPGDQPETVARGYDQRREDELLRRIEWPGDGYRLFEIGAALRGPAASVSWLNRMFESNCLGIRRELALALGGMDEAFDLPGGGFVNLDFFKRACEWPEVSLVELIGEGSFHQVHGGTTTNVDQVEREQRLESFRRQYAELRGSDNVTTQVPVSYLGHMSTEDSKIHRYRCGRLAASNLPAG